MSRRDRELTEIVAALEYEPHINIIINNEYCNVHVSNHAAKLPTSVSGFRFSPINDELPSRPVHMKLQTKTNSPRSVIASAGN